MFLPGKAVNRVRGSVNLRFNVYRHNYTSMTCFDHDDIIGVRLSRHRQNTDLSNSPELLDLYIYEYDERYQKTWTYTAVDRILPPKMTELSNSHVGEYDVVRKVRLM